MPFESIWVNPDKLLRYMGVDIYHTYADDNKNNGPFTCFYTTNKLGTEGDDTGSFDVRDLSDYTEPAHPPFLQEPGNNTPENRALWKEYRANKTELKHYIKVIKAAIKKGELVAYGD